ncbi:MarR family winged helix-turn-helix transcriptional regulator [Furfurilactobacillus sp. WILCCON 0119]|uniref:MarR family winged helix-turn-helix transcriptional regulator n=1 Tax=Furfurilactobacillus entadae TaxID=2922307 RepID=UPI0035ECADBE
MDQTKIHQMGDLYARLLAYETMHHPFDQRFRQALMHGGRRGPFGNHGEENRHVMHDMQHWSEHVNHHFNGPMRDVLETIQAHPNINARTISETLDILPGTLSKYLKRLISRHLVAEQTNPENRREKFYSLTDAGTWLLTVAHGVQEDDQQNQDDVFEQFNDAEQDVIIRFLTAMQERDQHPDQNSDS